MSLGGPPPSTLSDMLRYVVALYAQAGLIRTDLADPSTGIEIIVGERYEQQEGAPPRLFFRPDKDGKLGPVYELTGRSIGSWSQSCNVYTWGAESAVDLDRYDSAMALAMQAQAALQIAGVQRATFGPVTRQDGTSILTFGEEYAFRFEYVWEVPRDATLEAAAIALGALSQSPTLPDQPNGPTGDTFSVNVVMQNGR